MVLSHRWQLLLLGLGDQLRIGSLEWLRYWSFNFVLILQVRILGHMLPRICSLCFRLLLIQIDAIKTNVEIVISYFIGVVI